MLATAHFKQVGSPLALRPAISTLVVHRQHLIGGQPTANHPWPKTTDNIKVAISGVPFIVGTLQNPFWFIIRYEIYSFQTVFLPNCLKQTCLEDAFNGRPPFSFRRVFLPFETGTSNEIESFNPLLRRSENFISTRDTQRTQKPNPDSKKIVVSAQTIFWECLVH